MTVRLTTSPVAEELVAGVGDQAGLDDLVGPDQVIRPGLGVEGGAGGTVEGGVEVALGGHLLGLLVGGGDVERLALLPLELDVVGAGLVAAEDGEEGQDADHRCVSRDCRWVFR
jgi:hypothetical protein